MRGAVAIAALAVACVSAATAQEPDRLERFAGVCERADGETLGAYSGRMLWMADGEFSGMLTRDAANDAADAPRSLSAPKQRPERVDDAWRIAATVRSAGDASAESPAITCTLTSTTTSNG